MKSDEIYSKMYGEGGKTTRGLLIDYMVALLREMGTEQRISAVPQHVHIFATKIDDALSWPWWIMVCDQPTRDEILSLAYRHTCSDPELDEILTISRMLLTNPEDKELWQELVNSIDDVELI